MALFEICVFFIQVLSNNTCSHVHIFIYELNEQAYTGNYGGLLYIVESNK